MKRILLSLAVILVVSHLGAQIIPEFSTAGFFEIPDAGRKAYSMNMAWRFYKGDLKGEPQSVEFDDTAWQVVSIPHGLEYLPFEASGCVNYQGVAWYRKHFTPENYLTGKQLFIHFEAIMGKSEVYLNGRLLTKHYGGYLPVIADVTQELKLGEENIIAVKVDNSDDAHYPIGKAQNVLDFTYFGGIYRDCWLVAHNHIFITNSNYENEVAGGGLFVSYDNVSNKGATVNLKAHVRNSTTKTERVAVSFELQDHDGNIVGRLSRKLTIEEGKAAYASGSMRLRSPNLWSPETPYLYNLYVKVSDGKGNLIDGYRQRIGIRSIEFKNTEGLWINGRPYEGKMMGTNRHQDFAVLGNAVPNSMQWRDAKKLKDAGMKVIRSHYVLDPAFMDACDELGLFSLVEVPGWQFWSDEPIFAERVYSDIRNMIRIHRNHACLFFWEPVLNETFYPEEFAKNAQAICTEEYPYPYSVAACDHGQAGDKYYPLLLRPIEDKLQTDKTYFIREWGDNVDDWNAQNSDNRVSRSWGEVPMLVQAEHYARPYYVDEYPVPCYDLICRKPTQIVGGCFWHSFDHQRGYHADPFYGGMMDAFRQPKTSYYMFMSQRSAHKSELIADNGPMVYLAHEITPFSPSDITVYSNCEEVRLTVFKDGRQYDYKKDSNQEGMPSPVIVFKDAYHYMELKKFERSGHHDDAYILAEGLMDGKVVAVHKRFPAGQANRITLRLDNEHVPLTADGADVVTVIAEVVDAWGTVKRLNNSIIRFDIEGEGRLLASASAGTNPCSVIWGSAPVLVQSTGTPGKIKVIASMQIPGRMRPLSGVLEFESIPDTKREIYSPDEIAKVRNNVENEMSTFRETDLERENERLRKELNQMKVKEVEKQQTHFGVGMND